MITAVQHTDPNVLKFYVFVALFTAALLYLAGRRKAAREGLRPDSVRGAGACLIGGVIWPAVGLAVLFWLLTDTPYWRARDGAAALAEEHDNPDSGVWRIVSDDPFGPWRLYAPGSTRRDRAGRVIATEPPADVVAALDPRPDDDTVCVHDVHDAAVERLEELTGREVVSLRVGGDDDDVFALLGPADDDEFDVDDDPDGDDDDGDGPRDTGPDTLGPDDDAAADPAADPAGPVLVAAGRS